MLRALAIETSGRVGSVAVVEDGRVLAEDTFPHGLQHAAEIIPRLDGLCRAQGWSPAEVRELYVSAGPGSFTGLRIGVGMSWLAIVASEMLLGGVGVGFFIWDQYNSSRISDIVVALTWVGLVGFALDRLVALLGHIVSRGASAG